MTLTKINKPAPNAFLSYGTESKKELKNRYKEKINNIENSN